MRDTGYSRVVRFRTALAASVLIVLAGGALQLAHEIWTSELQARYGARMASQATYTVGAGPSPFIRFPRSAPYDHWLGYSQLPVFLTTLKTRNFDVTRQARISNGMMERIDAGYFAPYYEKSQSGLRTFRTLWPGAPPDQFTPWLQGHLPAIAGLAAPQLAELYATHAPQAMSLADRGHVAGVHPLELWLVGYLSVHPGASQTQVMRASVAERQGVYSWLFKSRSKQAQDRRILGLLEADGFDEIHCQWVKMGYPFDSLVPSYATALGASADRPAALAQMMGILVNAGLRKPSMRIETLHFAAQTPYETLLQHRAPRPDRVLAPEVAQAVLGALRGVVEEGTARRVKQAFVRPDGSAIAVGGKTGTGDQRFENYGSGARLISSRVVSRSASFVFNIEDCFFGTIIAYVPGVQAATYDFTSALPVQLLKLLASGLMPLVHSAASEPVAAGGDGITSPALYQEQRFVSA